MMVDYYYAIGLSRMIEIFDWAKKHFSGKGDLNVLISYLELSKGAKNLEIVEEWKENEIGKIFLDSGAFTYLYGAKKGENTYDELRNLFESYLDFLLKYADLFDVYAELDVQEILGLDEVEEMRDVFEEHGLKPLYGWHGESFDVLLEWTERTDYIGFPIRRGDEAFEMIRRLRDVNDEVKIHLFGATVSKTIYEYRITSCDSTVAMDFYRYGQYLYMDGDELKWSRTKEDFSFTDRVVDNEDLCRKYDIEIERLLEEDAHAGLRYNIVVIYEFKKKLDEMYCGEVGNMEDLNEMDGKKGKGAKKVKKGFGCKVCMYAERCPVHDEGSDDCELLSREWNELVGRIGGVENFDGLLRYLIEEKTRRYLMMRIAEKLKGTISKEASRMENEIFDMVERYVRMKSEKSVELKGEDAWERILQEMQKVG